VWENYPRVLPIAYETFYPYSTFEMDRLFIKTDLTPLRKKGVMAIHWFNGNEISKQFVNGGKLTSCSMTEVLKAEGYVN
jgi:hypothetical protein